MISFFHEGALEAGAELTLSEDAAHHARVRRVAVGDAITLLDGRGAVAGGVIKSVDKHAVLVDVTDASRRDPPPAILLLVPVADRERMLFVAEKSVELGIAVWQPVYFKRSRHVTPRGEGDGFERKVVARMRGALEQSGGAWLPELRPPIESDAAFRTAASTRLLLDASGEGLITAKLVAPVALLIGPEGGLEPAERSAAIDAGWRPTRIEGNILRFETAAIAAVAITRSMLAP